MSDPRRTPANERVAADTLRGRLEGVEFVKGESMRIGVPVTNLLREPGGGMDCQLLLGAPVRRYETRDGWAFVQSEEDGYVGYIAADCLREPACSTHAVRVICSSLYERPDMKTVPAATVSYGSRLCIVGEENGFMQTGDGMFLPRQHLSPVGEVASCWVGEAERFLGIPYVWGGNSCFGVDCSGLVQLTLSMAGMQCPRDSGMQVGELGEELGPEESPRSGDFVFWEGHVGIMHGEEDLVHATAYHMLVAREPLETVIARNLGKGAGPVVCRRRLAR